MEKAYAFLPCPDFNPDECSWLFLSIVDNRIHKFSLHTRSLLCFIFTSLSLVTYIDEDENEVIELSSNKTFFIMLKIPEECVTEEELPHLLTKRVITIHTSSLSCFSLSSFSFDY